MQCVRGEVGVGPRWNWKADDYTWRLYVENETDSPIKVQGYLLERFGGDIPQYFSFKDHPSWAELQPKAKIEVAFMNDRSMDQRYWQFYTYHLNVMKGDEKNGFTIKLGWVQRKSSHSLVIKVKKHPWHNTPYLDYSNEKIKDGSFVFQVVKNEESAKTFDAKEYGIAEMERQFSNDQLTRYDKNTQLINKNCVVKSEKRTRLEHTLKGDPDKTIMSAEDYAALKSDNPSTYEQLTSPVYMKDIYFTMSCNGVLTHNTKTVTAELEGGLIHLDDPGSSYSVVESKSPQDSHINEFAEQP